MKITKRNNLIPPVSSMNLFIIPLFAYLIKKIGGVEFNQYEFIWWIVIPISFVLWVIMNFKINK